MMSVKACESDLCQPRKGAPGTAPVAAPSSILRRLAIAPFRFLQDVMRGIGERRILDALSHHSLQDIGLTRFEVDYEMGKAYRRD
jgi:uncharacterized protein YjiS (DUF1127 family)